ncbi:hypothetical protein PAXRUDRAFT_35865 [Paxillus rubicundulus Ve08.2h10]|uniref:G-patch domain-containing protein n=1 Tax=Paxillus rubicundulus Ve08.2h10 TaxID=930991 RepID=A0A0D0CFK5_9AGAM|nr:hypothetical protein PAXRUDRAFT_35865 [Paxillus rubicundulus Ve08.2h10]
MAYNRDWDKGKDYWADQSSWGTGDNRADVRGRENDYHGDGKRRKYNNGGYDNQPYDDTSYDAGYGPNNQGRHTDHTPDYSNDDRPGKGFQSKKRLVPSEASSHVIFLGLDPDFSEADLQAYLSSNGCNIETCIDVCISKGFGFAQFASVEHARAFVDPLFPFIQVPPPASHGASAKAAFYKALESGLPHNGRRIKIDYSQSAMPHDKGRRQNMNDGTRDIGNAPAAVLLFRGLDSLSGPQAIAQAMMGSAGPGKDGHRGMKRIILVKDKVTMASFQFAFVEFADIQAASTVLANSMSPQIHPSGFRISDKPVAASFAHPYSFQPVADYMLRDESAIPSSLNVGGVENTFAKYWDESATVAVLEFQVEEPVPTQGVVAVAGTKEREKKKKAKDEVTKKPPAPSALPVSDKPVTLNFKAGATSHKPSAPLSGPKAHAPLSLGFSAEDFAAGDEDAGPAPATEDDKVTAAKKVAPLIASKKTATNIQKWNQVQEALKEGSSSQASVPRVSLNVPNTEEPNTHRPNSQAPVLHPPAVSNGLSTVAIPDPVEVEFEFSDTIALTCLLCARQFKTNDQLKRHNKESDLHKARFFIPLHVLVSEGLTIKNFKDANLRDVARQKIEAARKIPAATAADAEQPKYRDRASERRTMHNQPDVPLPENTTAVLKKKRFAEGPPPPPSPPLAPLAPGKDENNVGNKLLKMMGWKEGSGLGTEGDGRVDPIQTAIYAQGVGLGASKAKEMGKYAEGYSGYVHMVQDVARERYGS